MEVFPLSHKVEILSVGTELLLGSIANTDAQMLSQGLSALGLNVYWRGPLLSWSVETKRGLFS